MSKLKKYTKGGSLYDHMERMGLDGSLSSRKKLFSQLFSEEYTGTAEQNTYLLNEMRTGKLRVNDGLKDVPAKSTRKSAPVSQPAVKASGSWRDAFNKPKSDKLLKTSSGPKKSSGPEAPHSGVVVDKRTGQAYVTEGGKVVRQFPVVTGKNVDGNKNDISVDDLDGAEQYKATPAGYYAMQMHPDIYGAPGFSTQPISAYGVDAPQAQGIGMHVTYDAANRDKLYNSATPWASYGCVNCRKPDVVDLSKRFPTSDTLLVVDSQMPQYKNVIQGLQQRRKDGGLVLPKYNIGDQVTIPALPPTILGTDQAIPPPVIPPVPAPPPPLLVNPSTVAGGIGQPDKLGWWDQKYKTDQGYQQSFDQSVGSMLNKTGSKDAGAYNKWFDKKYNKQTGREYNVEAASMATGALSMVANQMGQVPDHKIYQNMVNRGTTDSLHSTYHPTNRRGFIDMNTGFTAPDQQTLTQYQNKPAPNYYGQPFVAQFGMELPDMRPAGVQPESIDALLPVNLPSAPVAAEQEEARSYMPMTKDTEFLTYMAHQQGEAGIKAIVKAAKEGRSRVGYVGRENIDRNMFGKRAGFENTPNVSDDFKGDTTPANFLNYWEGKFKRHINRWSKKKTDFDPIINELAPQFGFSPEFVKGVIGIESGFNPTNVTGKYKGLLQLSEREAKENGASDVFDPYQNILAGLKIMAKKRDRIAKSEFKNGGEYDLNDEQIAQLKAQGYEIEVL